MTVCNGCRRVLAAICFSATLLVSAQGRAETTCPADPAMPQLHLPHLHAAIASQMQGLIVAIGSSSTEGAMASDDAHTYPAILQAALNKSIAGANFAVINRGIGGEDAPEELARLRSDAIVVRPQLVIWQVGANGAIHHEDPVAFHGMVTEGVDRLLKAGIDVILMDNQRSPKILAAAHHGDLDHSLAEVAHETGVNLFSRGYLMDAWSDAGVGFGSFIAADGMHENDRGYRCVTQTLARLIAAAVNKPIKISAGR